MKRFLIFILLLIAIYWIWSETSKGFDKPQSLKIDSIESYSDSTNKGNIVGIQPFMETGDYATEGRFLQKIQFYFEQSHQKGWLIPNQTVVVLPEYTGSWLVTIDEKNSIYESHKIEDGLTTMVTSNVFSFAKNYFKAPDIKDKIRHSVFAMKAERMAEVYQKVFSELANKYKVTVVAGSILLPNPTVDDGKLIINDGQLFNTSCVFRPDGRLDAQLVKKAFPVADELPFVCPADAKDTPVFDTPIGKMAVLICADAWFSDSYKALKQKGAEFIVVPSYSSGSGYWNKSWTGYSGAETPKDAIDDVKKISLGQAWLKHAMGGRAKSEAGIKKGLNVFLQGNLWDLGTDGTSIILNDSTFMTKHYGGSVLVNLGL
jgi:hypothetical protein